MLKNEENIKMINRRDFIQKSLIGYGGLALGSPVLSSVKPFLFSKNLEYRKSSHISSDSYTVLTTCPPYGSQNVGDKLIEQRTKELITYVKGKVEFLTIFREEPLEPWLEKINSTRAVLMPAFPIRDTPMYPGVYQLVNDLSQIKVPMIPVGANWNVYPGDEASRRAVNYSAPTRTFLSFIAGQVEQLSCREFYTCDILSKHGITNTIMTGDPAWFLLSAIGKPMYRPQNVKRVVFSPPLSPFYLAQAKLILDMLAGLFPDAERICAFHLLDAASKENITSKSERSAALTPEVTEKNRVIREYAAELGFKVIQMAGNIENLEFYQTCDLHVGYECHAHLNFFSRRIPSVLIAEDARGVGFNYGLGIGGFNGFMRVQPEPQGRTKKITSGYCTSVDELVIAPPKMNVHEEIKEFLIHELRSGFRRYIGLSSYLDDIFKNSMKPFIESLP